MKVRWDFVLGGLGILFLFGDKRKRFDKKVYVPGSAEAIELFTEASRVAGHPEAWGSLPDLHYILMKESAGKVGIPNYTFGKGIKNQPEKWPEIWQRLRTGEIWTKSTATGLGQLLTSNVKKFYPDGLKGIGDPLNEAVGMVRYIASRYGSPSVARSVYGRTGSYKHAITGKTRTKSFKEGY